MKSFSGTKIDNSEDELLEKSYTTAKKILETGMSFYLKPFILFKTFSGESGVSLIHTELDMTDNKDKIANDLKELCNQRKISDLYITLELQRDFDGEDNPVIIPEYYILITHETHLFSDIYMSKIIMNDDDKIIVSPLYKLDEGTRVGPMFNILCPAIFHKA